MSKITKSLCLIILGVILISATLSLASTAFAADDMWRDIIEPNLLIFSESGTGPYAPLDEHPANIIARVINVVLTFMGILFISLMIYAGITWMTAGGEQEKVNKARDIIKAAIMGLIIVIAAYAITFFIFRSLTEAVAG